MKRVEPIMVIILAIITLGIYSLVWFVSTKHQANANGAKIPTCWLLILPIVDIYWLWKFGEGIEYVTNKRVEGPIAFILIFFLGVIGMAIVQNGINNAFSAPTQPYQQPQQSYSNPPSNNPAPPPPPGAASGPPPIPPPPKSF